MNSIRDVAYRARRRIVQAVNEAGFSRARWPRSYALLDVAFEPLATARDYDQIYSARSDPWDYVSNPEEHERYRLTLEMLDRARNGRRFETALEVGCSEGAFSELLAQRCDSLLAVDFCPLALDRARDRCRSERGVMFRLYDLRREPAPGRFELVVAMDLLSAFRRPGAMRKALEKLVESIGAGGYLLITDHRQHPIFEEAWWARRLLRGGKWIVAAVAENAALTKIEGSHTGTHVLALFQRREIPA
jgi:SAM-dependent methyltransferase